VVLARREPLVVRLCFHSPLYELARLIGYEGLLVDQARQLVKALQERHGREAMKAAEAEIVRIDEQAQPPRAVLTDECLKVCGQLLGPPPGHPDSRPKTSQTQQTEAEPRPARVKKPARKRAAG
jgi:hypothetical protein